MKENTGEPYVSAWEINLKKSRPNLGRTQALNNTVA